MWPIKTILFPTDFSDCSLEAFVPACSLARGHGARIIALHVTSVPDLAYTGFGTPGAPLSKDQYLAEAQQALDDLEPASGQCTLERRLQEGDPAGEILRLARDEHADVIVMGTHGQTCLHHLLMGGVAEQVVRKATCPVLTLRMPLAARASGQPEPYSSFVAGTHLDGSLG